MAMAIAVVNSYFPALNSTVKFRCSISSQRLIPTSQSLASKLATSDVKTPILALSFNLISFVFNFWFYKFSKFVSVSQRKLHETLTDGRVDVGRSQSTAFKSFGAQRKDRKELQLDSKEQQVFFSNFKSNRSLETLCL